MQLQCVGQCQACAQSLQCFLLSTNFQSADSFVIVWVHNQSICPVKIVKSGLQTWGKLCEEYFLCFLHCNYFEYNDFPLFVLPLVSWKPSPSPRKASAWPKRLYVQTSCFSKYRGECLPGFYMERTYSTWRLVLHVSSGAFDHFNKTI